MLELGPRGRAAFAACWVAAQAGLVSTGGRRADGAFAFRMFPEASTIEIQLERVVAGAVVPVLGGGWSAHDGSGQLRHFAWGDRVRDPVLSRLDERVFASYGADAQLARLQRALDDVADHVPEDDETGELRADVVVWRNGRGPEHVTLASHARAVP